MSPETRALLLFFSEAKNTNEIAKLIGKTEPWVDRVIATEVTRRSKVNKPACEQALKLP